MVLRPEKREEAEAIFVKWGLDFAIVGKTTDDLRFRILFEGKEVANLPIKQLGDEAPEYDRPWVEPTMLPAIEARDVPEPADYEQALLTILGSPDIASRRWVFEQYDTLIQGNSLQRPGGDGGLVRVDGHPTKALAFSSDVTPRYCEADPYRGGAQAVAECWRNLTAVGAEPLAATDNLNFGNPEKPEIMGQFVKAIEGIGEACRALGFPIVSGNVSLYNETHGAAILPTPTIGGVGLVEDRTKTARTDNLAEGDVLILVGGDGTHLGASIFLREIHGREEGRAPEVDLEAEKRNGDFVRGLIRAGTVRTCHDLSDGGLAVALAELAIASKIGVAIEPVGAEPHAKLFGEDQGRYVIAVKRETAATVLSQAEAAGVPALEIGGVGGHSFVVEGLLQVDLDDLTIAHESWFPNYMSGRVVSQEAA